MMEAIHRSQDHQAHQLNPKYLGKTQRKWKKKLGKNRHFFIKTSNYLQLN